MMLSMQEPLRKEPEMTHPTTTTLKPRRWSLLAAAAATSLVLSASLAGTALAQPHGGPGHRGGGHGQMMHLSERMLDRINATPEQRTQIRQIMDAARTDMQAQRQAQQGLRDQAMQLFAQPNVDARAAEALRQQMLAQHDQRSKRMMQAMIDASRVLTPEQRKLMADNMKKHRDMRERHQRERRALDAPKS